MKKTTSKLLSLLLAVIMVIGILPISAFAADGDKIINEITITGLAEPVIGKKASTDYDRIPDTAGYGVYGDCYWYESTEPLTDIRDALGLATNGYYYTSPSGKVFTGKFQAGKYYTFVALAKADDGYSFNSDHSKVNITVNGRSASTTTARLFGWPDETRATLLWITFGPVEAINEAYVTVTPPKIGESIDTKCAKESTESDLYDIWANGTGHNVRWYVSDSKPTSSSDLGTAIGNSSGAVTEGKYYTAEVILKPNQPSTDYYYSFSKDTSAYINNMRAKTHLGARNVGANDSDYSYMTTYYTFGPMDNFDIYWYGNKAEWDNDITRDVNTYIILYKDNEIVANWILKSNQSHLDFSSVFSAHGPGEYFITVEHRDKNNESTAFNVGPTKTVRAISSVKILTKPKTEYIEGENFDPTGLGIEVTYADGNIVDYSYAGIHEDNFSFSADKNLKVGQTFVTISFQEDGTTKSVLLPITVRPNQTLKDIVINTPPAKTSYKPGDTFDPSGMVVYARYQKTDGTIASVRTLSNGEYTISPTTELEAGTTKVTVSYTEDGKTVTKDVPIRVAKFITEVTIDITPDTIPLGATLADVMTVKASGTGGEFGHIDVVWGYAESSIYGGSLHSASIELTAYGGFVFDAANPETTKIKFTSNGESSPFEVASVVVSSGGGYLKIFTNFVECGACAHPVEQRIYSCKVGQIENAEQHYYTCGVCGWCVDTWEDHTFNEPQEYMGELYSVCSKCGYEKKEHLFDPITLSSVRLDDSLFYVGQTIPTTLSPVSEDSGKYTVTNIEWRKADGTAAGTTFEQNVEYILRVTVTENNPYRLKTSITSTSTNFTGLKVDTPKWAMQVTSNDIWKSVETGVYYAEIKGKPVNTAYADGKSSIDVTLPTDIAGKTATEVLGMIKVENARVHAQRASYTYMVYDVTDLENTVCWAVQVPDYSPQINNGGFVFKPGHNYKFVITYGWKTDLGWEEDDLVITNGTNSDILFLGKSISSELFNIDAVIAAKGETEDKTISYVNVTVDAPETGKTPDNSAELPTGANYTAAAPTWTPTVTGDKFAEKTEYTVSIELTAKGDYTFTDSVVASVNGVEATKTVSSDKKTCIVSYKFSETTEELGAPLPATVSIDNATFADATKGSSYTSVTLTATVTNGNVGDTLEWSLINAPSGMTIDKDTGVFSGTPTESGEFNFTVIAQHSSGVQATRDFTLTVNAKPEVLNMPLANGTVGRTYTAQLYADAGYPATITAWSATGLPNGLSCDNNGKISGTPTVSGSFDNIKVKATNATGTSEEVTLSLTINPAPPKTYYLNLPDCAAYKGEVVAGFSDEITEPDDTFKFTITINDGYEATSAFKVKANDVELTEDNVSGKTYTYTINGVNEHKTVTVEGVEATFVAAPIISPNGGEFDDEVEITIYSRDEDPNVEIYYTTDGSDPTTRSTKYTTPFKLTKNATVKAIAVSGSKTPGTASAEFSKKQYTVTVDNDGNGTGIASPTTAAKGETVTLIPVPKSGYRFKEWVVDELTPITITNNKFTMPGYNVRIYATFERIPGGGGGGGGYTPPVINVYYTLTFNSNGGSHVSDMTRLMGAYESINNIVPTRAGYDFTGWYSDAALTNKVTGVRFDSDKTVYAGWKSNEEVNPDTGAWVNPFIDVFERDWFFDDVRFANENDLMKGTGDSKFSPNMTTTRGMIVTILYRLEGEPTVSGACPFDDVKSGSYYEKAITWAAANGIVKGYGDGKFGPEDEITREQMAAILYRYADFKGYDLSAGENTNILSYEDAFDISDYAIAPFQWACGEGLINGMGDGTLAPQGNGTRAQIAAILHRFIEKFVK